MPTLAEGVSDRAETLLIIPTVTDKDSKRKGLDFIDTTPAMGTEG